VLATLPLAQETVLHPTLQYSRYNQAAIPSKTPFEPLFGCFLLGLAVAKRFGLSPQGPYNQEG
jgi:hypothetical protein